MMTSYQRMSSNPLKSSLARAMLINALLNIALSSIMVRAQRAMTVRPILEISGRYRHLSERRRRRYGDRRRRRGGLTRTLTQVPVVILRSPSAIDRMCHQLIVPVAPDKMPSAGNDQPRRHCEARGKGDRATLTISCGMSDIAI
jgi:hypothetical protein